MNKALILKSTFIVHKKKNIQVLKEKMYVDIHCAAYKWLS